MVNKVTLIGRLGTDPQTQVTKTGKTVCNFNMATDNFKGGKDNTDWHRVTVWDKQAENCGEYIKKGSLIYVDGRLETRKWQDKEQKWRYTTEVIANHVKFLDMKGSTTTDTTQEFVHQDQEEIPL